MIFVLYRYELWLKRGRQDDFVPVESLRCLYQSGFDIYNKPVMIFTGRNFPATKIDLDTNRNIIQSIFSVNIAYVIVACVIANLCKNLVVSPVRMYSGGILWFSRRYDASADADASADTSPFSR